MALSPDEDAALRDIERRLFAAGPPAPARRPALASLLMVGAAALLVVGVLVGNAAALVLGVTWFAAAVGLRWVQRHLVVVAFPGAVAGSAEGQGAGLPRD